MLTITRSPARVTWRIVFNGVEIFVSTKKSVVEKKALELAKLFGMEVSK